MDDIKVKDWLKLRNRLESDSVDAGILVNVKEFCVYPYKTLNKCCGTKFFILVTKGILIRAVFTNGDDRFYEKLLQESYEDISEKNHFNEYHN